MSQGSSPDHDASSSCSTASPGGDSPARGRQPPPVDSLSSASSMDSISQDPDTSASDSFVPTVTAISTSPGLRWMVQPTVITSSTRSPSRGGARAKARSKEQTAGKKGKKDQPSKEEEERRKIRRERNKIAAAKCRNRRRELTDTLQAETDTLEEEKAALQTEIADLLKEKERLEQVLASHKPGCTLHLTGDHSDDEVDDAAAAGMDDEVEAEKGGDDDDDDVDVDGGEDDVSPMQQDPPASPPPLSMWPESESLSEGSSSSSMALLLDSPPLAPQDLDHPPSAAAAILGNSNILLCSSAEEEEEEEVQEVQEEEEEPLEDLKGDDLDALVPSLEMSAVAEGASGGVAPAVPDIDLGGAFGLPDWETLYRSVARDLESLGTPLVSSSPTCGGGGGDGFRSVFSFSGAEIDSLQTEEDCLALRGPGPGAPLTKDSLNSPTMLAL